MIKTIGKLSNLPKRPLKPFWQGDAQKAQALYPGKTVYVYERSPKRGNLIFIDTNEGDTSA